MVEFLIECRVKVPEQSEWKNTLHMCTEVSPIHACFYLRNSANLRVGHESVEFTPQFIVNAMHAWGLDFMACSAWVIQMGPNLVQQFFILYDDELNSGALLQQTAIQVQIEH